MRLTLLVSEDTRHTVYISDGSKTVVPIRVKKEHQVSEGKVYLFIDVTYREQCCHTSEYSAVEEVRWAKKSAVSYSNTNALPGRRVLDKETVLREIGTDDTLCAALGINIKALDVENSDVPVLRDSLHGAVASLSIKSTKVESQLQCTYCYAEGLEPIAPNAELSAALSLTTLHAHYKCTQCCTIQSAERARKTFKVHGECLLERKIIADRVTVTAALVDQWAQQQKSKSEPQTVIAKAVEKCLCKIVKEHHGLRVDVIKSLV